jgi:putative hydrolase of HD superfamily
VLSAELLDKERTAMDKPNDDETLVQGILELGRLAGRFSQVNRGVPVDSLGTLESDTDHTVMLSLVACCVAAKYQPTLDIGKVAQYALVHDLVEAYCGDTNTIEYSQMDSAAKREREEKAHATLRVHHGFFSWLGDMIERYEALADPEARFVKAIDKAMPAVLHNLNDGLIFGKGQADFQEPAEFQDDVRGRDKWLRENHWARDQNFALRIREALMEKVIRRQWEKYG